MENKEESLAKLKALSLEYRELNKQSKEFEKQLDEKKKVIKELLGELNLEEFKDDDIKVKLTTYDKSYLEEGSTIKFLKANGLDKYVKQKEYFEPDELIIAANNGELKLEDLVQFKVEKTEQRLTIK